ncbi:MAG TPA: hypothetical protein VNQ73_06665 [Ilumatobacter sp.]|nr:hypothetical protein [Ilumatobacter sp.]
MRPNFEDWLLAGGMTPRAAQSYISRLERIAEAYGDVGSHYAKDRCTSLLDDLAYSTADKDRGAPNRSRLKIDGDVYNGLATLRSVVNKYVEFLDA